MAALSDFLFSDGGQGFITVTRYILPVLSLWILLRCVRSVLHYKYEPETWGYLSLPDGSILPLRHWECTLGRSRFSDVVVNYPTVSRTHAAVTRSANGVWTLSDLGSAGGTFLNGEEIDSAFLRDGDTLALAGIELRFSDLSDEGRKKLSLTRSRPGWHVAPWLTFFLLTVVQFILAAQHSLANPETAGDAAMAFLMLCAVMWIYFLVMRVLRRTGFETEALAFYLTTLGLSVAASSVPGSLMKQIILILGGIVMFIALGWWLRDLRRTRFLRWPVALVALAALAVNLLLSEELFGAKNWLTVGGVTLQPSEFVKIAYIYAGAATLDRLHQGRNLFMFIGFSAVCVGALALMGDFGTALVFFVTFLMISFMRSGNLATIFLAVSGAGLAGFLAFTVKPHIAQRFANWGHVWEDVNGAGYQQTRALSAAASGGLFGKGAGNGWLHSIVAADTDMVFGMLCEEMGLIVALCAVFSLLALAAFAVRSAAQSRSSYYVIAACAAVSMMMVQLALNVFGSMDILPFTGVTFPFVSRGGSSLVSCWTLLAFIKSSDTRQNASFVVRTPSSYRGKTPLARASGDAIEADGEEAEA